MQRLGQHFLQNQSVLRKVVESLDLSNIDTIIEIGPGHGELTRELGDRLEVIGDSGVRTKLIAIERDEKLAESLKKYFPKIELHVGDALKLLPAIVEQLSTQSPARPKDFGHSGRYSIVGNIPYYITGHLFRIVGELPYLPTQCVFTIQKEVAERICAGARGMNPVRNSPPSGPSGARSRAGAISNGMNKLSASIQLWAKPEIVAIVPREDFEPVPKVDSAIIRLTTNDSQLTTSAQEAYYEAVRVLFAQPRKTVLNNIVEGIDMNKEGVLKLLENVEIDPKSRPQDLSIEQITALAHSLKLKDQNGK